MVNEVKEKIESFTDLHAWQESHKLVVATYQLAKLFPSHETFGLVSQMQRAAVSITSNIAEGFSRSSFTEKERFYYIAKGSLTELRNQLLVARDVGYITPVQFDEIAALSKTAHSLLIGLIRATKSHNYKRTKK